MSRLEPLALELVGAAVSREHEVRLVDMMIRRSDLKRTLRDFRPDVAGVTTEAARSAEAIAVLRTVRRASPGCLTVAGGCHPTTSAETFIDPAVDLCVLGEGVKTFAELCAARKAGATSFEHIAGLAIRTDGAMRRTDPRPLPQTLDDQPLPDRSLTARYRKYYHFITEPSAAVMRMSFGCPNRCSFCSGPVYAGGRYASRDPGLMVQEIAGIREPFIYIGDNGSFHEADRMERLARMLLDAGIRKRYLAYVRADTVVGNPELFELWARAGMSVAMIGLEALDDESLAAMDKGSDAATNDRAVKLLEEIGISILGGFVLRPQTRAEDFRRLDRYIKAHRSIVHVEFTPLTPFAGTLYRQQHRDQLLPCGWDVYDLQHFVTKTDLPHKQLYRLMLRSYAKIVWRVVWRERLWFPLGRRKRRLRLVRGLAQNAASFWRAHRHVAESKRGEDQANV